MRKKHEVSHIHDHDILTAARQSDSPAVIEALEVLRTLTILSEGVELNKKWDRRARLRRERWSEFDELGVKFEAYRIKMQIMNKRYMNERYKSSRKARKTRTSY